MSPVPNMTERAANLRLYLAVNRVLAARLVEGQDSAAFLGAMNELTAAHDALADFYLETLTTVIRATGDGFVRTLRAAAGEPE